jgi:hypothetical protein
VRYHLASWHTLPKQRCDSRLPPRTSSGSRRFTLTHRIVPALATRSGP